jgi:hypothetical protein
LVVVRAYGFLYVVYTLDTAVVFVLCLVGVLTQRECLAYVVCLTQRECLACVVWGAHGVYVTQRECFVYVVCIGLTYTA